jgi:hypothetical protein
VRAVNLIPTEQRSGASVGIGRSQGGAYAVLALLAGVAVLALLYGFARHDIASRREQAASATAKAQQVEAQAERLAPYASFVALRQQRTQAVDTLVESRFDWAHLFHELGRVLPPALVSITSLTGTVGSGTTAAAAASAAKGGSSTPPGSLPSFTLEGCAIGQGAVALTLERLRLIDGVSEVTLQSSSASTSGGSSGSSGGCPAHDPVFTVALTFDPLPSEAAIATATKNVSDASKAGSGAANSSGVNAK